ncbi:MarR family winged helix-turn-helix transcriptional regulator [Parasphingorhabdus sp.]|uniref:MarR family winged helix-turn-helix transcriptional regulator n=1 Tax=Parasphingorhabdus sp. TaxID=2709688 RepID=UPI0032EF6720
MGSAENAGRSALTSLYIQIIAQLIVYIGIKSKMAYLDTHPLHGAFISNKFTRLTDVIASQGEDMLRDANIDVPSRAVSIVLLVGEHGEISAADIANWLEQPHQLVTQRTDVLIELGLIKRRSDPHDGRRKILVLTANGTDQFTRLTELMVQVADVFAALFEEIECDLAAMAMRAIEALERSPILERINSRRSSRIVNNPDNLEIS